MLFVAAFLLQFCIVLGDGPGVEDDSYILNFDSPVYVCADDESQAFVETSQIEVKRYNETISYMTGVLSFLKSMPPTTMVEDDSYILNFDSPVYVCADDESQAFVETSQIEVKRYNETISYMTGVLSFLKSMPPTTMVELVIDKEISGSFERFGSHEICDLCKELEDPESDYRDYFIQLSFPKKCPFEANDYHVKEFVAIAKDLPINSAAVGRYQVTITINESASSDCLSQKTFMACVKFDCIIEQL